MTRNEPGSFRDREGRVFYLDGKVFRTLSSRALNDWEAISATAFLRSAMEVGKVVRTECLELPESAPPSAAQPWVAALRHETIPFISYPYEWSFSMLKDAALLQLELLEAALEEEFIIKDSTPYNVQWHSSHPVFIDVPSFKKMDPAEL